MKQAILVISFGTSYKETREKNIGAIEKAIQNAFPKYEVRRAFTSGMIIKILKKQGIMVDTVEQALAHLKEEGFQKVICQPTHIMHGFEYDGIVAAAAPFQKQFDQLVVGTPLLSAQEDYKQAVQTLGELVPREPGDALVLMGHGTGHPANACYAALEYAFHDAGYKNVFVGTVEGYPDLEAVKRRLRESGAQRVFLTPFMVVFGDHAANDMAGDEEDSWKKQLEKEGCRVQILLKGLGEYPGIVNQYVQHTAAAAEQLG